MLVHNVEYPKLFVASLSLSLSLFIKIKNILITYLLQRNHCS